MSGLEIDTLLLCTQLLPGAICDMILYPLLLCKHMGPLQHYTLLPDRHKTHLHKDTSFHSCLSHLPTSPSEEPAHLPTPLFQATCPLPNTRHKCRTTDMCKAHVLTDISWGWQVRSALICDGKFLQATGQGRGMEGGCQAVLWPLPPTSGVRTSSWA